MSRTSRVVLAAFVVLAMGACTRQEPAISTQEQLPAAAREAAEAEAGGEGGGDAAAEGTPSTWVAVDVEFAEFDTELPAGPVSLTLDNQGNLPHDVTIEELGDETVVAADGGANETATVELEAGEYTFYCSVPGHRSTMEETVTVS